jgi:hypothetical protein
MEYTIHFNFAFRLPKLHANIQLFELHQGGIQEATWHLLKFWFLLNNTMKKDDTLFILTFV